MGPSPGSLPGTEGGLYDLLAHSHHVRPEMRHGGAPQDPRSQIYRATLLGLSFCPKFLRVYVIICQTKDVSSSRS